MTKSTYLLLHPEPVPTETVHFGYERRKSRFRFAEFDQLYGAELADRAFECDTRIALVDNLTYEELLSGQETNLTVGLPASAFTLVLCNAADVEECVAKTFEGTTDSIVLGGCFREDCIPRARKTLEKLNLEVELHEAGILPLMPSRACMSPYMREKE